VAFRGPDQLFLEVCCRHERLVFPQYRLEHDPPDVLALQALDDALRYRPFFENVAGGRNEYSQLAQVSACLLYQDISSRMRQKILNTLCGSGLFSSQGAPFSPAG